MQNESLKFVIEKLTPIVEKLHQLNEQTPDMTSIDHSYEHDWISSEEREKELEKAKEMCSLQDKEVEKIKAIEKKYPKEFNEFLVSIISELKQSLKKIKKLYSNEKECPNEHPCERKASFAKSHFPSVIHDLENWLSGKDLKYWPPWLWRCALEAVYNAREIIMKFGQNKK